MNIALESEKVIPLESNRLEMLKQIADALAAQFGPNCEVVIHDLSAQNAEHPIVYIVNGHVTGRKVGDGASYVVVQQLTTNDPAPRDHLAYLTRTPDGKILKSSTVYIRNSKGKVSAILAINYDISKLLMVESAVHDLISTGEPQQEEPEKIVNVNDLLEELIQQSVSLVGKPVALIATCGYPVEKGADLWEAGMQRYCKHSRLRLLGMLAQRHRGYDTVFMDPEKARLAAEFARKVNESI